MPKKTLQGTVVSNKMKNTLVVRVDTIKEHPKYKRKYRSFKKYKVHALGDDYNIGDKVVIQECRPISKEKKFRLIKKL